MQQLSAYNENHHFDYNFQESRLRKCAALIQGLPAGRLLDIGCAQGDWAALWQKNGWSAAGIDINAQNVTAARNAGLDAHVCDLNRDPIPFSDGSFDLVFAGEVIEHLVDTDGFVSEIHRVCK